MKDSVPGDDQLSVRHFTKVGHCKCMFGGKPNYLVVPHSDRGIDADPRPTIRESVCAAFSCGITLYGAGGAWLGMSILLHPASIGNGVNIRICKANFLN